MTDVDLGLDTGAAVLNPFKLSREAKSEAVDRKERKKKRERKRLIFWFWIPFRRSSWTTNLKQRPQGWKMFRCSGRIYIRYPETSSSGILAVREQLLFSTST